MAQLPSPTWALKDFARGYWTYSKAFPNYLRAVLDHLAEPEHRRALEDNLVEECGSCYPPRQTSTGAAP